MTFISDKIAFIQIAAGHTRKAHIILKLNSDHYLIKVLRVFYVCIEARPPVLG